MTKITNKKTGKTEEVQSYGFGFVNAKGEFIHRKNAVFCLGQAIRKIKDGQKCVADSARNICSDE